MSAEALLHDKLRMAMVDGAAVLDSLLSLMQARAALEETYSKSLAKLAKQAFTVNEKTIHPAVFEAIASLRGDIANEGVQHAELASSIAKDVVEPLSKMKDNSDNVQRISTEAKRVTKEVKAAYERCKKLTTKYIMLHRRAVELCSAVGLKPPALWLPPHLAASVGAGMPSTPTLAGRRGVHELPSLSESSPVHHGLPGALEHRRGSQGAVPEDERPVTAMHAGRTGAGVSASAEDADAAGASKDGALSRVTSTPVGIAGAPQPALIGPDGAMLAYQPEQPGGKSGGRREYHDHHQLHVSISTTPGHGAGTGAGVGEAAAGAGLVSSTGSVIVHGETPEGGNDREATQRRVNRIPTLSAFSGIDGAAAAALSPPAGSGDSDTPASADSDSSPVASGSHSAPPDPSHTAALASEASQTHGGMASAGGVGASTAATVQQFPGRPPRRTSLTQPVVRAASGRSLSVSAADAAATATATAASARAESVGSSADGSQSGSARASDSDDDDVSSLSGGNPYASALGATAAGGVAGERGTSASGAASAAVPQSPSARLASSLLGAGRSARTLMTSSMSAVPAGTTRPVQGLVRQTSHGRMASADAGSSRVVGEGAAGAAASGTGGYLSALSDFMPPARSLSGRWGLTPTQGAAKATTPMGGAVADDDAWLGTASASMRRQGLDDDALSVSTGTSNTDNLQNALAGRMKAMLNMSFTGSPTVVGSAGQSTTERIESMRAAANAAVIAAEAAQQECQEAWAAHARARAAFHAQITGAVTMFQDIDKKRTAEMCDSMRRYGIYMSSMLANLQYDVQRLATKIETAGEFAASTVPSIQLSAFAVTPDQVDTALVEMAVGALATEDAAPARTQSRRNSAESDSMRRAAIEAATTRGGLAGDAATGADIRSVHSAASSLHSDPGVPIPQRQMSRELRVSPAASADNPIAVAPSTGSRSTPPASTAAPTHGTSMVTPVGAPATAPLSTTSAASASFLPPHAPASSGSSGMGRFFGFGRSRRTSVSKDGHIISPLVPKDASVANAAQTAPAPPKAGGASAPPPPASTAGPPAAGTRSRTASVNGGPADESSSASKATPAPAAPSHDLDKLPSPAPEMRKAGGHTHSTSGSSLRGILSGFSRLGPSSPTNLPGVKKTGGRSGAGQHDGTRSSPAGISASVSGMGSVVGEAAVAGVDAKRAKEALQYERLHVSPGPVEHFLAALFDPFADTYRTEADLVAAHANAVTSPIGARIAAAANDAQHTPAKPAVAVDSERAGGEASGGEDEIPSLPLSDFAAGATPPVKRGSRGGSAGAEVVHGTLSGLGALVTPQSTANGAEVQQPQQADHAAEAAQPQAAAEPATPASAHPPHRRLSLGGTCTALNPLVPTLLPQVRKLIRTTPDGLSRLVMAMDARRGEGTVLTKPSFDALSSVMLAALDVADQRSDYARGRALMVMSQTFFCYVPNDDSSDTAVDAVIESLASVRASAVPHAAAESTHTPAKATHTVASGAAGDGTGGAAGVYLATPGHDMGATPGSRQTKRLYLQARVKAHRLWQNVGYWESAVFDSLGAEMNKINSESRGERQDREHDVSFGQLAFFGYNMFSFGVPEDTVRRLLDKYSRFLNMSPAQYASLMASVDAFALEHRKQQAAEEHKRDQAAEQQVHHQREASAFTPS